MRALIGRHIAVVQRHLCPELNVGSDVLDGYSFDSLVLIPLSLGGVIMGVAVKRLFSLVVKLLHQLGLLSD